MINSFSHLKKNDIIFDIINAFNNVKKNNFFKLLEQDKNFYNHYFAHEISNEDIKFPKWKENFNDLEINIIYEKITQIINLSIKNSNKIKRDHEIFNEIINNKDKYIKYFNIYHHLIESSSEVFWKKNFNETEKNNIKKLVEIIENSQMNYKTKVSLENNNNLILKADCYRKIINKINDQEIQIPLDEINREYIEPLSKLNTIKICIISKISSLNTIISSINKLIKSNTKAYGFNLNELDEDDENLFFRLSQNQLLMIMIFQDNIINDDKLDYDYLINQFLSSTLEKNDDFKDFIRYNNEKMDSLFLYKKAFLDKNNIQYYENFLILKKKISLKKFYNFSNKKIWVLLNFNSLTNLLEKLDKSGGQELIKHFLDLEVEKLEIFSKFEDLASVIFYLDKSCCKELIKDFLNLKVKKLEIFSEFKNLRFFMFNLIEIGLNELVNKLFHLKKEKLNIFFNEFKFIDNFALDLKKLGFSIINDLFRILENFDLECIKNTLNKIDDVLEKNNLSKNKRKNDYDDFEFKSYKRIKINSHGIY